MQPGELVGQRFAVDGIAGEGGMGTVYRAVDRVTGEVVAVKVLHQGRSDAHARFAREIRVLQGLEHPAIVRYVADGTTAAGEPWLAMEWLAGESLADRLAREGMTAREAVGLARRVAEALGVAHEHGVVHRDVKPSNLMLLGGDLERVKVLDFGVARVIDATRAATRTGVMIGTPGYMAPEQARGSKDVGPAADVFGLGCVLFECLTGRVAFSGDNIMAVLAKLLLEEAPRLSELRPELPGALDRVLVRALAKDPGQRQASGALLAAELAAVADRIGDERADASPVRPSPVLTSTERRLLCVVLIAPASAEVGGTSADASLDDTLVSTPRIQTVPSRPGAVRSSAEHEEATALGRIAHEFGASLQRLVDGSYVVAVGGDGDATDQAARAARCALAMKAHAPHMRMAVATGRGVFAGHWPVGEAIDRAAHLLALAHDSAVRLDEITAGLLATRFEIAGDGRALTLVREREPHDAARTLLGKPTPCVGRDRELGVLVGLYSECVDEPIARAVVVTGAPGVGKSRVRYELLRRIRERGEPVEIWIGRGDALAAGSPYGVIASAVRRAAGISDGEPLDVKRQKLRARVIRYASVDLTRTTMFLGELVGVPFDDEDAVELRAARADPQLMSDQIRRAFEHFIGIETAVQPLVLVLEDMHWGDSPTAKLLDAALRALPDRPWLVVALARPEIHALFPRLWAERGAHELRLDELTKKGSERLVRGVLGAQIDDALVARIVDQAAGNAFFLEELIRVAAEGSSGDLPETVLALMQGRLEQLEIDARRVLRAASVFGRQFWRGGVQALLGAGEASKQTAALAWLDELIARELVSRAESSRFPGQDQLQFRHALVREAAYAMLTDGDRALGHRLAGEWLAHIGEQDPVVLAEHFERGGDPTSACDHYRRAAEHALAACDFASALARAERGVRCGATAALLGALQLVRAEANRWVGDFGEAGRYAREALALLPAGSARWFTAAYEAAEAAGKQSDHAQLLTIGELLRAAPDGDRDALAARVTATACGAFQLYSHGHYELAEQLLDRVERAASAVSEPGILARIYQARSSRSMFRGDAGAYLESERAAAIEFERAGDSRYACMQRGHVGYACLEIGAYREAEHWLRLALEEGVRLNLATVVATAKHNLSRALHRLGMLAEALAMQRAALEVFHEQGDRRLEAGARVYLAELYRDLGDLERADAEARLGLELGLAPMRPQSLAVLTEIQLALGHVTDALASAREGYELLVALGGVEEGESLVRLAYGEALRAVGHHATAVEVMRVAQARILERAAKISDEEWRRRFMSQIPENVRTLAFPV